jgi:hypothetical protein
MDGGGSVGSMFFFQLFTGKAGPVTTHQAPRIMSALLRYLAKRQ